MTWLLCALMLAAPTRASAEKDRLQAAEKAFDRYEYGKAVKKLEALLADQTFVDEAPRQRALLLLAFSLFLSDRRDLAAVQLQTLFAQNAEYPIARDDTNPELLRFFDGERAQYLASQPAPASISAVPASVPTTAPVSQPVVLQTVGDKHPWVRIFPAGIGHFANHDFAAGAAFLSLEAALLATHITFGVLHKNMLTPDGRFYRPGSSNTLAFQIVTNVAGIAAIALAVVDIIDAFIWSPARGRATLHPVLSLGALGDFTFAVQ